MPEADMLGIMKQLSINTTPIDTSGLPNRVNRARCSVMDQLSIEPGFIIERSPGWWAFRWPRPTA